MYDSSRNPENSGRLDHRKGAASKRNLGADLKASGQAHSDGGYGNSCEPEDERQALRV